MAMKKFFILILLSVFAKLQINSQTYSVGRMSINFKDPTRAGGSSITGGIQMPGSGRDIGAEIYYPATNAGTNVAVASGSFPVVIFAHGFVMTFDNYDNISNSLASKGFIVALPRTEGGFAPNHLDFGKDISYLAGEVIALNTTPTPSLITYFNSKVIPKVAIGGHSMGGGCSFIGAQNNTTITCVFNMAAATSNTAGISSVNGASLVTVPSLVLSGQKDCVADTIMQNNHYNLLASQKKFHVIIKDLTHCDFGNGSSFNCTFGQNTSGCANSIGNSVAFTRYMNYLEPFLNNQLKDNCVEGQRFMDSIYTTSTVRSARKITGSIACLPAGINNKTQDLVDFTFYPNPVQEKIYISTNRNSGPLIAQVQILDPIGRILMTEKIEFKSKPVEINLSRFDSGIYSILFTIEGMNIQSKTLIKI